MAEMYKFSGAKGGRKHHPTWTIFPAPAPDNKYSILREKLHSGIAVEECDATMRHSSYCCRAHNKNKKATANRGFFT